MKKKCAVLCCIGSVLLTVAFVAKTIRDRYIYLTAFTAVPFRIWVLINGILFPLPAVLLLLLGYFLYRRGK